MTDPRISCDRIFHKLKESMTRRVRSARGLLNPLFAAVRPLYLLFSRKVASFASLNKKFQNPHRLEWEICMLFCRSSEKTDGKITRHRCILRTFCMTFCVDRFVTLVLTLGLGAQNYRFGAHNLSQHE